MRKKRIKQLNDALLDNTEVDDGVLDMAREEIKRLQNAEASAPRASNAEFERHGRGKKVGGAVAVSRRRAVCAAGAVLAVCIIAAAAIIIKFSIGNSADIGGGSSYNIADLDKEEITSISGYNAANGTDYLYYDGDSSVYSVYGYEDTDVMIEQDFAYQNCGCVWYIVINHKDYIDILNGFEDLPDSAGVNGYTVYYGADGGAQYAVVYDGDCRYCLLAQTDDERLIFDVLNLILM